MRRSTWWDGRAWFTPIRDADRPLEIDWTFDYYQGWIPCDHDFHDEIEVDHNDDTWEILICLGCGCASCVC